MIARLAPLVSCLSHAPFAKSSAILPVPRMPQRGGRCCCGDAESDAPAPESLADDCSEAKCARDTMLLLMAVRGRTGAVTGQQARVRRVWQRLLHSGLTVPVRRSQRVRVAHYTAAAVHTHCRQNVAHAHLLASCEKLAAASRAEACCR